ncbi:histidine kinase dimerization/phosphoacceptor domain -containing protein [Leptolyngbya sp. FACHB-261]|uniref:histidine kinase dimerization/phosphoacceptor domain -containing protein n=1 Tax=Leptolyngbya sp. FACHB-261 TaxID=2692806 RepID=UPI0016876011|nr:histidine kinase dimerization/phosphoacceptor domain -containing protein [Leptolyngbya sp. FACHB-261]MBD2103040.1 CBS domain-containing protein [Leptolyngbya sp. FACHB-261]
MQFNRTTRSSAVNLFAIEPAIDSRPLTATPDVSVLEAVGIMGKARGSCALPSLGLPPNSALLTEARASAILVVEGTQLLGILTAREAVQLIASNEDLEAVKIAEVMSQPATHLVLSEAEDIFTALALLRQHRIRHLPVLDQQGQLAGLISLESIRRVLQLDELLKSCQLAEVTPTPVLQAPATTSVLDLARLMAENQADSVLLTALGGEAGAQAVGSVPVGLITEHDIVQLRALGLELEQLPVQGLSTPLPLFDPSQSVLAALWQTQQQQMHQFLVSDSDGELLGTVTSTSILQTLDLDLMRSTVEQLQHSVEQFEAEKHAAKTSNAALDEPAAESSSGLLEQLECNRLLTAMALHIRESLNLDEILKTAVAEVRQFLQTDRVLIYQFNPDFSGTVVVESVADAWQPALGSTIQDTCFGKNYAHLYKEGRIQATEDIYAAGLTQCHIDILALFDIRANLVVPILQGEHLWGLLCAYHCSEPRRWRQLEVELLQQLATHTAIAIQQSELYQHVQAELAERKRAEEQIKAALTERELLLKEIHHRVKNNLQIISTLLGLQSGYVKDEQALTMFKDSQNRIRSMALIHEKLYRSKDLSRIDFAEYILDLSSNLLRSYTASSQEVSLKVEAKDIWLNIDTAIPCGLIINELVSNSLKHAFPEVSDKSEILITIVESGNRFAMTIRDNGIGFPQNLDFRNTESLGLELVCTLTEQLEGNIELDSGQGTAFTVTFAELESGEG